VIEIARDEINNQKYCILVKKLNYFKKQISATKNNEHCLLLKQFSKVI